MDYWVLKADDVLVLNPDLCHLIKTDLIPPNPTFQHSIIPVSHGIRIRSAAGGFTLTRPKGLDFRC